MHIYIACGFMVNNERVQTVCTMKQEYQGKESHLVLRCFNFLTLMSVGKV